MKRSLYERLSKPSTPSAARRVSWNKVRESTRQILKVSSGTLSELSTRQSCISSSKVPEKLQDLAFFEGVYRKIRKQGNYQGENQPLLSYFIDYDHLKGKSCDRNSR